MSDPPVDEVTIVGAREAGTWKAVVGLLREGHHVRLVVPLRATSRRDVEAGIKILTAYIARARDLEVLDGPKNNMRTVFAVVARNGGGGLAGSRVPRRPLVPTLSGHNELPPAGHTEEQP